MAKNWQDKKLIEDYASHIRNKTIKNHPEMSDRLADIFQKRGIDWIKEQFLKNNIKLTTTKISNVPIADEKTKTLKFRDDVEIWDYHLLDE